MEIMTYREAGEGKVKVFFTLHEEREPSVYVGDGVVVNEQGFQFYVDKHVADQLEKCEIYLEGLMPKLRLKEGETLEVPEKSEKEKEIERLKQELEKLMNDDVS